MAGKEASISKKKKASTILAAEPTVDSKEATRLRALALEKKLFARTRREPDDISKDVRLPLSADIAKSAVVGEIVRPKSLRTRYLLCLPGTMKLSETGEIGTLDKLDTMTPVLELKGEGGTLRLNGSLTYLKNKILALECKRDGFHCPDQFDSVIAFSEYAWHGSDGREASIPADLLRTDIVATAPVPASAGAKRSLEEGSEEEVSENDDGDESEEIVRPSRSASRGGARAIRSESENEDDKDLPVVVRTPKATPTLGATPSSARPRRAAASAVNYNEGSEDEAAAKSNSDEDLSVLKSIKRVRADETTESKKPEFTPSKSIATPRTDRTAAVVHVKDEDEEDKVEEEEPVIIVSEKKPGSSKIATAPIGDSVKSPQAKAKVTAGPAESEPASMDADVVLSPAPSDTALTSPKGSIRKFFRGGHQIGSAEQRKSIAASILEDFEK